MTDQGSRYDRVAAGYERWWAPVLAPSARALLDRLAPIVAAGARDVIEVGVGTGTLARAALARWPGVEVVGIDASGEMIAATDGLVATASSAERARYRGQVALAADLPFPDGSFDLAMSSFVLQLVPNRASALREARRVLRPGGAIGYVTWMREERAFAPDRVFDDLLDAFGFDSDADEDGRDGDVPSVATAAAELRRAGFADTAAEAALLEHPFTVDSYIGFLTEFDETSTFEEMGRRERQRFLARLREGLMALPPDDLVFRASIVYATGRRSDR